MYKSYIKKLVRRSSKHFPVIWLLSCVTVAGSLIANIVVAEHHAVSVSRTMAIQDVRVGDWVLAKEPGRTGDPTRCQVIALPRNWTEHIVNVHVDSGALFHSTREHPFFTDRGWIAAKDLKPGDRLHDASGSKCVVTNAVVETRTVPTFNLTVEGAHTFYVVDHGTSVLVHNAWINGRPAVPTPSGPPPVPVPGAPGTGWQQTGPPRDGVPTWLPAEHVPNAKGGQPAGSWDNEGHWDVDDGNGNRSRYDWRGNPILPNDAHNRNRPSMPNNNPCP